MFKLNKIIFKSITEKIVSYLKIKRNNMMLANIELAIDEISESKEDKEARLRKELKQCTSEIICINERLMRVKPNNIVEEDVDIIKQINKSNEGLLNNVKRTLHSFGKELLEVGVMLLEDKIIIFLFKLILKIVMIPLMIASIPLSMNTLCDYGINALISFILVVTFNFNIIVLLIFI